jgi:hypothetical protein
MVPFPWRCWKPAAPGYLTNEQRATAYPETWFASALDDAQTLVKRVVAALGDVARPSGMGAVPGLVRLADYLEQYGRVSRAGCFPPSSSQVVAQADAVVGGSAGVVADQRRAAEAVPVVPGPAQVGRRPT